jgi:hypothetical protein
LARHAETLIIPRQAKSSFGGKIRAVTQLDEEMVGLPRRILMRRKRKSDPPHPYKEFEKTGLWKALDKGIRDLVENQDLKEITRREYIVGYLCKVLTQRRGKPFSN